MKRLISIVLFALLMSSQCFGQGAPTPVIPIKIQNNGSDKGGVDTINFGSGTVATVSGHTATVTSSGGSSPAGGANAIQYYLTSSSLGGSSNATLDGSGNEYLAGKLKVGSSTDVSDTGVLAQFISATTGYNQVVVQNTAAGTGNSANYILGNDSGSTATKYAEFGLNSSGFTGSGSWNIANAAYLDNAIGDVAIGTLGNNAVHIFANSSTTDAVTVNGTGIGFYGTSPIAKPTGNICTAMTNLGLVSSCTESGGASLSANQTFTGNNWFNNNSTVVGSSGSAVLDTLTVQTGATSSGLTINGNAATGGIDSTTQLMLHLNNNVTDSSHNNFTATNNNVTFSNSSPALSGTYYGIFNQTSGTVSVPDNSALHLGSSNFTIDLWKKWGSVGAIEPVFEKYVSGSNAVYSAWYQPNGNIYFVALAGGVEVAGYHFAFTPAVGTWYHIAYVRSGTNFYIFINGVSQSLTVRTAISTNNIDSLSTPFVIGHDTNDGGQYSYGGMQEFRLSSTDRWTSNFTPPTVPYSPTQAIPTLNFSTTGTSIGNININSATNVMSIVNNGVTALSISGTGATTLATGSGVTGGATGTGATSCLCKTFSNGICTVIGTCT